MDHCDNVYNLAQSYGSVNVHCYKLFRPSHNEHKAKQRKKRNFYCFAASPSILPPSIHPPGWLGPSFHFFVAAPASSGPEDFQYYVTTTEFTEEAILMKVQVSQLLARADPLGTSTGLGEDGHGGE